MTTTIRLRQTSGPGKLVFIRGGEVELNFRLIDPIKPLKACGWFLTRKTTVTNKTNFLNNEQIFYVLRSDDVKSNCFMLKDEPLTCGVCKKLQLNK